jgi:predicted Zn-dependent protease
MGGFVHEPRSYTVSSVHSARVRGASWRTQIPVLRRNTEEYPDVAKAQDSLGEAYMARGDKAIAVQHDERSLALDAKYTNAAEQPNKLRAP